MEIATETLTITLTEPEKRKLRIAAAAKNVSMGSLVREWVRAMPATLLGVELTEQDG